MKIRVFQSAQGDCLLLETAKGKNILVDGGWPKAYRTHVAPFLGKMHKAGAVLDLVYVSHIDRDHIGGILEMLDDLMAWRVYEYRSALGLNAKKPKEPRPPEVKEIWHNAFATLLDDNEHPVEELLAQFALLQGGPDSDDVADPAGPRHQTAFLASSVDDAIRVSQRVSAGQMNIPLNKAFDGRLIMVREPAGPETTVGGVKLSVIGPFEEDVANLRDEWNAWLADRKAKLRELMEKAAKDGESLGQALGPLGLDSDLAQAILGDRKKVTVPNLASVMLLAQEGSRTVLLTGDGHSADILEGLDFQGALDPHGAAHFDVLKLQHHGSEHNIDEDFCRRVTADHYIICGNGLHENPDLRAIEALLSARVEAENPRPFKLWFNCASSVAPTGIPKTHMRKVEKLVARYATEHPGLVRSFFLEQSSFTLSI
jgi:hypothetical protein